MSKYFELMQKIDEQRESKTQPAPENTNHNSHAIPRANAHSNSHARVDSYSQWASDEALRLVQQIFLTPAETAPRLVAFAGIDPGNGCSEICVSAASSLARSTRGRVCLVEANFYSPTLPQLLQTTNYHGLIEALEQPDQHVSNYAKSLQPENLWLLSSGKVNADSSRYLHSDGLRERLMELRDTFDYILIDAPPLTRYSEGLAIGQVVDGLVLVLEAEATRKEAASAVMSNLRAANIPVLAAVLNKRNFPIPEKIYRRL
jgi:polysaccharide biosynthesis transport protein